MPNTSWHEFDAVSWAIIEQLLAHIGVLTFQYNTAHSRALFPYTNEGPNKVYIHMEQSLITPNRYPIKVYYIHDMDLRKYYRLMYMHHIAHHSEKSIVLEDIRRRLYPENKENVNAQCDQ